MKPGKGFEGRGLPAAERADDHAECARRNLHRAIVNRQDVDAFGVVDLGDVSDAEHAARRRTDRCIDTGVHSGGHSRTLHRPCSASARACHCIRQLPTKRTIAEVNQPTKPSVSMAMTIGTVTPFMYELTIR